MQGIDKVLTFTVAFEGVPLAFGSNAKYSTSPFYPLFAALDVNAKMHEGEAGKKLWIDCVETVIDARKTVLNIVNIFVH